MVTSRGARAERVDAFDPLDLPPELRRGLALYIRELVRAELASAAAGPTAGARIRHDRTGLASERALAAIHSGKLVAVKDGKFWYIKPSDLDAYFATHGKTKAEASEEDEEFSSAMTRLKLRKGAKGSPRR